MGITNFKKAPLNEFDIVRIAENEVGYNYYLYLHPSGQVIIMREDINNKEYLFADGGNDLENAWANRASLNYDLRSKI